MKRPLAALLLTLVAMTGVGYADDPVVRLTGTTVVPGTGVPGVPTQLIEFQAFATRATDRVSRFTLRLINNAGKNRNTTINFVVCFMTSLRVQETVDWEFFGIEKVGNEWVCRDIFDGFGDNGPPTFHFGCRRVTLEPGRELVISEFINWNQDISDKNLAKAYIDFLKDCPLRDCDQIKGGNQNLVPTVPEDHPDWVNVWADQAVMPGLAGVQLAQADQWPSQNWVAMGDRVNEYPATLIGTFEGASAGTVLQMAFNGIAGGTYTVPPDPASPPCGGQTITVAETFVIPPDLTAEDGYKLRLPDGPCGQLAQGSVVRLHAQVLAREGAPAYAPGDFMYQIDSVLVKDTTPPDFVSGPTAQQVFPDTIRVNVEVTDAATVGVDATLIYSVNGGPVVEQPMQYISSFPGRPNINLVGGVGGLSPGDIVTHRVRIIDEFRNVRESALQTHQVGSEVLIPWVLIHGQFAGAQVISRGDTALPEPVLMDDNPATGASGTISIGDLCMAPPTGDHFHGTIFDVPDPDPSACGQSRVIKLIAAGHVLRHISETIAAEERALALVRKVDFTGALAALQSTGIPNTQILLGEVAGLGIGPKDADLIRRRLDAALRLDQRVVVSLNRLIAGSGGSQLISRVESGLLRSRERSRAAYDALAAQNQVP